MTKRSKQRSGATPEKPAAGPSDARPKPPSGPPGGVRRAWTAALIGGLCGALAMEPAGFRALMPLAPAGLFLSVILSETPRKAALRVLAGAFLYHFGSISWLVTLGRFNPMAPAGIAFVAFYMALYPAGAAWLVKRGRFGGGFRAAWAAFAALWLLSEWFRSLGKLAMPFSQLSHAWAPWPRMIQLAEFGGELAVSAFILLWSTVALEALVLAASARPRLAAWTGNASPPSRRAFGFGAALTAALLLTAASWWRYRQWEGRISAARADGRLKVAAVQPNIDQETKMASYLSDDPVERARLQEQSNRIHEELTSREIPPGTGLVVMPETTFASFDFVFDVDLHVRVEAISRRLGADLIFGADRFVPDPKGGEDYEAFNTAFFLPRGRSMSDAVWQDKMRLVPFGEHLPYFDMIPYFNETLVQIASFTEGRDTRLFESKGGKFGALVCFESTFASQARRLVRAGAEAIAVITNDAWYGFSAGPPQHHNLSILRAVETRRPVVRAANTGISSLIESSGRIAATLPLGRRGAISGEILPQRGLTLFTRLGNAPLFWTCLSILILGFRRGKSAPRSEAAA